MLYFDPESGYLRSKETQSWVFGSLLGESTHFSNGRIKQICIKPFARGWYRFIAVIAAVSGYTTFHVQSFKEGVTFGTSMFKPPADRKPKNVYAAPVQGPGLQQEVNGKLRRKTGCEILTKLTVPVYDGREGFQLGKYWNVEYDGEVTNGSTVMVLFSTKRGELAKAMKGIGNLPKGLEFGVYFQILSVVVLTGPSEQFSDTPSQEGPEAFGVDRVQIWGEVAGGEDGNEGEKEDEVIDEPLL